MRRLPARAQRASFLSFLCAPYDAGSSRALFLVLREQDMVAGEATDAVSAAFAWRSTQLCCSRVQRCVPYCSQRGWSARRPRLGGASHSQACAALTASPSCSARLLWRATRARAPPRTALTTWDFGKGTRSPQHVDTFTHAPVAEPVSATQPSPPPPIPSPPPSPPR